MQKNIWCCLLVTLPKIVWCFFIPKKGNYRLCSVMSKHEKLLTVFLTEWRAKGRNKAGFEHLASLLPKIWEDLEPNFFMYLRCWRCWATNMSNVACVVLDLYIRPCGLTHTLPATGSYLPTYMDHKIIYPYHLHVNRKKDQRNHRLDVSPNPGCNRGKWRLSSGFATKNVLSSGWWPESYKTLNPFKQPTDITDPVEQ